MEQINIYELAKLFNLKHRYKSNADRLIILIISFLLVSALFYILILIVNFFLALILPAKAPKAPVNQSITGQNLTQYYSAFKQKEKYYISSNYSCIQNYDIHSIYKHCKNFYNQTEEEIYTKFLFATHPNKLANNDKFSQSLPYNFNDSYCYRNNVIVLPVDSVENIKCIDIQGFNTNASEVILSFGVMDEGNYHAKLMPKNVSINLDSDIIIYGKQQRNLRSCGWNLTKFKFDQNSPMPPVFTARWENEYNFFCYKEIFIVYQNGHTQKYKKYEEL